MKRNKERKERKKNERRTLLHAERLVGRVPSLCEDTKCVPSLSGDTKSMPQRIAGMVVYLRDDEGQ